MSPSRRLQEAVAAVALRGEGSAVKRVPYPPAPKGKVPLCALLSDLECHRYESRTYSTRNFTAMHIAIHPCMHSRKKKLMNEPENLDTNLVNVSEDNRTITTDVYPFYWTKPFAIYRLFNI